MTYYIGNARGNEYGTATGGQPGDQTGKEVCIQPFYIYSGGWKHVIRAKKTAVANELAAAMVRACNNENIGYDWRTGPNYREQIYTYKTTSTKAIYCDCSSLVCECCREATGANISNFATGTELNVLLKSGYFEDMGAYTSGMKLYTGDILLGNGHTAIVTNGESRGADSVTPSGATNTSTNSTLTSKYGDPKYWGPKVTKAMQKALGTTQDGIVSSQPLSNKKYLANCETDSWKFVSSGAKGSQTVKALQKKIGATQDGLFGKESVGKLQTYLNNKIGAGLAVDKSCGPATVYAICVGLERGVF